MVSQDIDIIDSILHLPPSFLPEWQTYGGDNLGLSQYDVVCVVRGILNSWKQFIYFDFDIKTEDLNKSNNPKYYSK